MSKEETTPITKFITKKQACRLLCISLSTLQNYINGKTLKAYQIGGRILLKYNEVVNSVTELEK